MLRRISVKCIELSNLRMLRLVDLNFRMLWPDASMPSCSTGRFPKPMCNRQSLFDFLSNGCFSEKLELLTLNSMEN